MRRPRPIQPRPRPGGQDLSRDPSHPISRTGLRRLRLDLGFLGSSYRGWQVQSRGITVQGLMDEAFKRIDHRGGKILGCSRTDSGVHALRFSAHLDTGLVRPLPAILKGLNANLPSDVRVFRVGWAPTDFHARYASTGKAYRYHLYLGPVVPPALHPFVWQWQGELDARAMESAASAMVGEHDFAAFTTADGREKNTRRTITECRWERRGDLLVLHVSGPSFLHRMVRCIAGLLVAVGGGRLGEVGDVAYALTGALDGPQIPALPAQGLTLWSVNYPESMEPVESYGGFPEEPMFPV